MVDKQIFTFIDDRNNKDQEVITAKYNEIKRIFLLFTPFDFFYYHTAFIYYQDRMIERIFITIFFLHVLQYQQQVSILDHIQQNDSMMDSQHSFRHKLVSME